MFPHSTFDNDGMKSSKHEIEFLSLIFLLCFSKSIIIKYSISIDKIFVI